MDFVSDFIEKKQKKGNMGLTLGTLDDSLELFTSVTEFTDTHAGIGIVQKTLGSIFEDGGGERRGASGKVVNVFSVWHFWIF